MRKWKPQLSGRLWLGIALLILAGSGALWLLVRVGLALGRSPEQWPIAIPLYLEFLLGLVLLLLAGMFAYRVLAALTLSYGVDRNGFYIFWLGNRAVVPLAQITSIESGVVVPGNARSFAASIGYYHGRVRLADGRMVHRFSTLPLTQALLLHTPSDSYAISPMDSAGFAQELEQRRRLGAIQQLATGVEVGRMFFYSYWEDRVVRAALLAALALNLLLLGWLAGIYSGLPALIELRADAVGAVAAVRPRHQVLFLPLAGFALTLLNTGLGLSLYRREPVGARVLQIASLLAQILFAVALLTIVI